MKRRQKTREIITIISFLLCPATFYYLSPYLIIDGTIRGIITVSLLLLSLLILSSLFLGKAFCGRVCPAAGALKTGLLSHDTLDVPFHEIGRKLRNLFNLPTLQLRSNPET